MRHLRSNTLVTRAFSVSLAIALGQSSARAQEAMSITMLSPTPCSSTPSVRVNLSAAAPAGGLTIQLTSTAPASAAVPATINVAPGATSADFRVTCVSSDQSIAAVITAMVPGTTRAAKTVVNVLAPVLSAITFDADTGGPTVNGKVTLIGPAPAGGVTVALSTGGARIGEVPPFVTVPAGATSANVSVRVFYTPTPSSFTIVGTALGVTKSAVLTVLPPHPRTFGFGNAPDMLTPSATIPGGKEADFYVVLDRPAASDFPITLSSSDRGVNVTRDVIVQTEHLVDSYLYVRVTTNPVSQPIRTTLSATAGGVTKTCVLTIVPPTIRSLSLATSSIVGGGFTVGTIRYSVFAPVGGTTVRLLSSDPSVVAVQATVTVPEGSAQATFKIATSTVRSRARVIVTAESYGERRSVPLEIVPNDPAESSSSSDRSSEVANSLSTAEARRSTGIIDSGFKPAAGVNQRRDIVRSIVRLTARRNP